MTDLLSHRWYARPMTEADADYFQRRRVDGWVLCEADGFDLPFALIPETNNPRFAEGWAKLIARVPDLRLVPGPRAVPTSEEQEGASP